MDKLLRLPEVMSITGLSRATIYRQMQRGLFPQSILITSGAIGWRQSDVEKWIESRMPTTSVDQVRGFKRKKRDDESVDESSRL